MADLDGLIKELKRTSEGHRELDYKIALAMTGGLKPGVTIAQYMEQVDVPPYSRSIDAALLLVPAGWIWHISIYSDGEVIVSATAHMQGDEMPNGEYPCGDDDSGKPPALALCIAALKAKAASHG